MRGTLPGRRVHAVVKPSPLAATTPHASSAGRGATQEVFMYGRGGGAPPSTVPARVVAPPEQRTRLLITQPRGLHKRRFYVQEAPPLLLTPHAPHGREAPPLPAA